MHKLTAQEAKDTRWRPIYAIDVPDRLAQGPLLVYQRLSDGCLYKVAVLQASEVEGEVRVSLENGLTMTVELNYRFSEASGGDPS